MKTKELTKPQMVALLADQHKQIGELQSRQDGSQLIAAFALLLAYQRVHDLTSNFAQCPCPTCLKVDGLKTAVGL